MMVMIMYKVAKRGGVGIANHSAFALQISQWRLLKVCYVGFMSQLQHMHKKLGTSECKLYMYLQDYSLAFFSPLSSQLFIYVFIVIVS